ncbi:DNA mismatch repair protein MutL [Edhazardia aedis USNM 41457]|uniref:DNA mismatch repair protein MutL n=1 Tax=Edhazardia aedis (strain USNM 41457) TaxID=1003232 RepID=J8ZTG5_EDHAE|nr:DNA mismatch repair protein MutL [Edhazardia aedis USNM 41457]|eukprot:EJW02973.1 DNA mismatch repair protein MutL [Edhazardia aedis USNM 41457]
MLIRKLPDDLIAKISAGEVITSPFAVIKEILENSIDAGSLNIEIKLKKDFSHIVIIDDGCGISEEDFPMVCKRHCTSKYTGDLLDIPTFGFRGEALASISQCSKIQIESKKENCHVGYSASYENYEMLDITPKALNNGTTVYISDIFGNNQFRKNFFAGKRDEIIRIINLVTNYSIFYSDIQIRLYLDNNLKFNSVVQDNLKESNFSLKTKINSKNIQHQKNVINSVYKTQNHLLTTSNENFKLIVSDVSFSSNKYVFILFINGRIVSHKILKDKIYKIYKDLITKHKFPLVYIEIYIDFNEVDINVHPSKAEVLFCSEEKIINEICKTLSLLLENSNKPEIKFSQNSYALEKKSLIIEPFKNIYTDPFSSSLIDVCEAKERIKVNKTIKVYNYESLKAIKSKIKNCDTEFLKNIVYVGESNGLVYIQSGAYLMSCEYDKLKTEYFYQQAVLNFGNYDEERIKVYLESSMLEKHKNILKSYFKFNFKENKVICAPIIDEISIQNNILDFLSEFNKFDAKNEQSTFEFLFRLLSKYYSKASKNGISLFNSIKRKCIGTKEVLDCFSILTSLNELYKLFERC